MPLSHIITVPRFDGILYIIWNFLGRQFSIRVRIDYNYIKYWKKM